MHVIRPIALALLLVGCSPGAMSTLGPQQGADAGTEVRTGPYDECGNGFDDDGDGLIDEGCPCGTGETQACFTGPLQARNQGECRDGLQRCEMEGSLEWGTWGPCEADATPGEEICDGELDEDCDGAVDTGCPCAEGDMRECEGPALASPCSSGTQQCHDGGWSSCEGAVEPEPETCGPTDDGDGIDNDCDGETDERCSCVPEVEICGDGIDNDCDGAADERACETHETPDAGPAPIPTEGCTPASEVCNGMDDDCDGLVDEDAPCSCDYRILGHSTDPSLGYDPSRAPGFNRKAKAYEVAFDGTDRVVIAHQYTVRSNWEQRVELLFRRTDGTEAAPPLVLERGTLGLRAEGIAYRGSNIVVVWRRMLDRDATPDVRAAVVSPAGTVVAGPVTLNAGEVLGAAVANGTLHVAWNHGGRLKVGRFGDDLSPIGAPVDAGAQLGPTAAGSTPGLEVEAFGDGVAVLGPAYGGDLEIAVVRGGELIGRHVVASPTSVDLAHLATDGSGYLACWKDRRVHCRFGDATDGRPTSFPLTPITAETATFDLVHTDCGFRMVSGTQLIGRSRSTIYEMRRLRPPTVEDISGVIETIITDRQLDNQPHRTLSVFELPSGDILRVNDDDAHTVGCGLCEWGPEPACVELARQLCEAACACSEGGRGTTCDFSTVGGFGSGVESCTEWLSGRVCGSDARDCEAAIDAGLSCYDYGPDSKGLIPPGTCFLPVSP